MIDYDHYALTRAISVLTCLDAERRGVEPNAMAMAERDEVMRRLTPGLASDLREILIEALDTIKIGI